ncbi:hypothetical protein EDC01DRAFT_764691 [Geopyxis carbonaria]|nr:hypothetical protein EDC01DRAFT_764691 [Geopyxis carbonaria]
MTAYAQKSLARITTPHNIRHHQHGLLHGAGQQAASALQTCDHANKASSPPSQFLHTASPTPPTPTTDPNSTSTAYTNFTTMASQTSTESQTTTESPITMDSQTSTESQKSLTFTTSPQVHFFCVDSPPAHRLSPDPSHTYTPNQPLRRVRRPTPLPSPSPSPSPERVNSEPDVPPPIPGMPPSGNAAALGPCHHDTDALELLHLQSALRASTLQQLSMTPTYIRRLEREIARLHAMCAQLPEVDRRWTLVEREDGGRDLEQSEPGMGMAAGELLQGIGVVEARVPKTMGVGFGPALVGTYFKLRRPEVAERRRREGWRD